MAISSIWWVLALVVVIAELMTGTFYLLMVSVGLVAGALAAHLGASLNAQIIIAALVGGGATLAWHLYKIKQPGTVRAEANPDVNQDVGATVMVDAWRADGSASVKYRGAQWAVVAAPGVEQAPGSYRVLEVKGSTLVVQPT
jgi:membrane protein implicated in regulation of membrane protease activity